MEIKKGDIIGILGISGSGKSTLIDLISGLIKPTSGMIKINDIGGAHCLFNNISYLPQIPYIMNSSLYENIILGGDTISPNHVSKLLQRLNLDQFVQFDLGMGLDTVINENNLDISGGQRQRIAIARLLCSSKDILILDEPTSSLDEYNENSVFELISKQKDKTIIIISHKRKISNFCTSIYEFQDNKFSKIK